MARRPKTAIIAAGGNSLIIDEKHKSIPDQYVSASITSRYIVDMIEQGWNVVVTHGNGPQVGFIMRRSEIAIDEVPPIPMDYAGADTQGAIGYMFQKALRNEMHKRKIDRNPIAVVTQILVDKDDPAFTYPSKPIGSFMDESTAKRLVNEQGWTIREEGDRGWRRVVPSPTPKSIVDISAIETLIDERFVVIACGGGGIPVYKDEKGMIQGIEAVIDKDFASGLLSRELSAELFIIATEVERVAIDFGTKNQRWLNKLTRSEAINHLDEGQFPEGNMGPKVSAIIEFLEAGGSAGIITNPPNLGRALAQKNGTWIVPD